MHVNNNFQAFKSMLKLLKASASVLKRDDLPNHEIEAHRSEYVSLIKYFLSFSYRLSFMLETTPIAFPTC